MKFFIIGILAITFSLQSFGVEEFTCEFFVDPCPGGETIILNADCETLCVYDHDRSPQNCHQVCSPCTGPNPCPADASCTLVGSGCKREF